MSMKQQEAKQMDFTQVKPELGIGVKRFQGIRKEWTKGKENYKPKTYKVDVESVVEDLFNDKKPKFKNPVSLPDMVDILIEIWEEDGFFD
eukprot:gene729-8981_t